MEVHQTHVKGFAAVIVLALTLSLGWGCSRQDKDLVKLQEENRVLRKRLALLEGRPPDAVGTTNAEMNDEILVLARKLKASPDSFVGQLIKLHGRLGGFQNKFLDERSAPNFSSNYYIGFVVQSGKEINGPVFDHLFLSKKEAKEKGVYHLRENGPVTVYGIVRSAYMNDPWIEVYEVKKGWE